MKTIVGQAFTIVNGEPVVAMQGQLLSFPDDAVVEVYPTLDDMLQAYLASLEIGTLPTFPTDEPPPEVNPLEEAE